MTLAMAGEKKLLLGQDVEVRQLEEGLRGAWHAGAVIKVQKWRRYVEYKELLSEDGVKKLVENIQVSEAVEGLGLRVGRKSKIYRGCIRPLPPALDQKWAYKYGLCVDAFFEDAWWEGILLDDLEDSEDRPVLFPDEGDVHVIHKKNLRVTQDWDEKEGTWSVRGHWVLASMRENFEREGLSIRVVWYYLREKVGFIKKVGEWTSAAQEELLCAKLMKEVVAELTAQPSKQILPFMESSTEYSRLTCNYSNTQQPLHAELKASNKTQESEESLVSNLVQDNDAGAIICCEKSVLGGALDSTVSPDIPIASYTSEKDSMTTIHERTNMSSECPPELGFEELMDPIEKELCNASSSTVGLGVEVDCIDKECSRSSLESQEVSVAEVKEQAGSAGRESFNSAASKLNLKEQMDSYDTVLLKDLLIRAKLKGKKEHIDRMLSDAVLNGAGLKEKSECIETLVSESPSYKTCLNDKTECIDTVLSESLTNGLKDQNTFTNVTELSNKVSGNCKSHALAMPRKSEEKQKLGLQSTPTLTWEQCVNKVNFDSTYCPPAVLNYKPNLDKNLKKEACMKAKMHLLAVGWKFEFKNRPGKERCDIRYVSPTGHNYYSLFKACSAWKNEQKHQATIDGNCEDNAEAETSNNNMLGCVSASLPLQNAGLRVRRNKLACRVEFGKKRQRVSVPSEVARCELNNDNNAEDTSKIYKGLKQGVSKGGKLHNHGNKQRSVTRDVLHLSETSQRLKVCDFQSEFFDRDVVQTNGSTEGTKSKNSGQGPEQATFSSSKKRKFNLEGSRRYQKQKKAKRCHLLLKRNGKSTNGHRMQALLSTSEKSKDVSLSHGRRTVHSVLSWMIENDVVAENQRVFYWNRKENYSMAEGWITREGIRCKCCRNVYSLSNFEFHAGSKLHRPSTNLVLEDGRSLLQCQMKMLDNNNRPKGHGAATRGLRKRKAQFQSDDICKICHFGGKLILCDHCPNSFHIECINMELVPKGKWYCPNCRCTICGRSEFNGDPECFTELTVLFCDQCECQYHVGCLYDQGMPKLDSCPKGNWFCSERCSMIFSQLRGLVGMVNPLGVEGLSWMLLRSTEEDHESFDQTSVEATAEHHSKLFVALSVMQECFTPIIESRTKKDLVEGLIFNRGCDRNLLNFRGFYTMILEKGDELISVATVRIHGQRVAEMPLIGTRIKYRRKGMCRLLVKELEKLLHSLGVERLILPAISELKNAWEKAFGFQRMTSAERFELLQHSFVNFPDTTVLQKLFVRAEGAASESGLAAMHFNLGSGHGEQPIQGGIVPKNFDISTSKIGLPYADVTDIVTPIWSLPCDTSTYKVSPYSAGGNDCIDDDMKRSLLRGYQHDGSVSYSMKKHRIQKNSIKNVIQTTPVEDDLYLSKVVVGTTRSNRLVRQVKWKVAYSCHRQKLKPFWSEEHQFNGRECMVKRKRSEGKSYKKKEDSSIQDRCPVITVTDSLESSQDKDVQLGNFERRKHDEEDLTRCRKSTTTVDGNCLSTLKASASAFNRPTFLEGRSNCEASHKENVGSNSHTLRSSECYRENDYGHLSCIKSFKYFYRRRRRLLCSGNHLYGDIPSDGTLSVRSLHSNAVR
ncbi:hypothetical protein SUGI_0149860 [Cryptomeria japonica]|uniref:uncharacterized protein LOC131065264 n=1 Tax=Cryptomeria japonica TaxID=3369 RepID=UPI002408E044|nr:uncharacterized protein LOC131065264 [Cryptomeria japonica]GLJ11266.1 hypothetical protein SUGI_0149860 [Cryptomeria japonica]